MKHLFILLALISNVSFAERDTRVDCSVVRCTEAPAPPAAPRYCRRAPILVFPFGSFLAFPARAEAPVGLGSLIIEPYFQRGKIVGVLIRVNGGRFGNDIIQAIRGLSAKRFLSELGIPSGTNFQAGILVDAFATLRAVTTLLTNSRNLCADQTGLNILLTSAPIQASRRYTLHLAAIRVQQQSTRYDRTEEQLADYTKRAVKAAFLASQDHGLEIAVSEAIASQHYQACDYRQAPCVLYEAKLNQWLRWFGN